MIYFIQAIDNGNIKIGFTAAKSAETRRKTFQTGYPAKLILLGTIPGTIHDEKSIHKELKSYNTHGEWFRGEFELLRIITKMIDTQAPWHHIRAIRSCNWDQLQKEWFNQIVIPTSIIDKSSYEDYATQQKYRNNELHQWRKLPKTNDRGELIIPAGRLREEQVKRQSAEARCHELEAKIRQVKRSIKAKEDAYNERFYGEVERQLIVTAIAETEQEFAFLHVRDHEGTTQAV